MLILTRRLGEAIIINDDIVVTVLGIRGLQVRLGFEAPKDVTIHREEIYQRILEEREAQDILAGKIPEQDLTQSELARIHTQTTNGVINTILGGNKE